MRNFYNKNGGEKKRNAIALYCYASYISNRSKSSQPLTFDQQNICEKAHYHSTLFGQRNFPFNLGY
jgi:hypothetical protein